jgi:hypothetical protein
LITVAVRDPSHVYRFGPVLAATLSFALLAGCTSSSSGTYRPPTDLSGTASPAPSGSTSAIRPIREVLPELERFVEETRGLKFKHPVRAELLGRKAFLAKLHSFDKKPKPIEVEKVTAVLSSLQLVSPKVDIEKAFDTATDAGTLGFYSPKTKRLYVKGTHATPGVRSVLVHELTHALTDQWFGLHRPKLEHSNQELGLGFTALIEGDAERTHEAYKKQLSPADRALAEKQQGADQEPPDVPEIVLLFIGFPYIIGPQFVSAVVDDGGLEELNKAYRKPPTSSEQLFDPEKFIVNDQPARVSVPHADGPELEHGDLGLLGLFLMLRGELGNGPAMQSVLGWGGDQFVVWRAGDNRWCLRDTLVMDYEQAAARLDTALDKWAAASDGQAVVEQRGERTTFRTCSS